MAAYYFTTYTGAGTSADPFVPLGSVGRTGWTAIDLRPNAAVAAGRCLFSLPTRQDLPGMNFITENLDAALTAAQRGPLNGLLGLPPNTLQGASLRALIIELLTQRGGPGRWRNVQVERSGLRPIHIANERIIPPP